MLSQVLSTSSEAQSSNEMPMVMVRTSSFSLLDHLIGLVDLHDVQHGLFLTGYLKTSLAVTLIRGIRMAPSAESPPGFPPLA